LRSFIFQVTKHPFFERRKTFMPHCCDSVFGEQVIASICVVSSHVGEWNGDMSIMR